MDAAYDQLHAMNVAFNQLIRGQINKEDYDKIIQDPSKYMAGLDAEKDVTQNAPNPTHVHEICEIINESGEDDKTTPIPKNQHTDATTENNRLKEYAANIASG